jgi:hypothetical protein
MTCVHRLYHRLGVSGSLSIYVAPCSLLISFCFADFALNQAAASLRRSQAPASVAQKPTVVQLESFRPSWYPLSFAKRVSQLVPSTARCILEAYASYKDPHHRLRAPCAGDGECAQGFA